MKYSFIFLLFLVLLFSQCKTDKENALNTSQNTIDFIGPGSGCTSFFVYKLNENKSIGLTVNGVRDALMLNNELQSFDVATESHIKVKIEELNDGDNFYCDDVVESTEEVLNFYEGYNGTVKVQILEDSIDFDATALSIEILYKINVELENINLKDNNGEEYFIENEKFTDVLVGWLPG